MVKPIYKRMAARLSGLRQTKLPVAEVAEAGAIAKRVVEVLGDESRPRKDALRDMKSLVKSLESVTRALDVLQVYFKQQDELVDTAVSQFGESSELLADATKKLEAADHESRHIETYLTNMEWYAEQIVSAPEFQEAVVQMTEEDYQPIKEAFERIEEVRKKKQ